jgi:hypothetical protein
VSGRRYGFKRSGISPDCNDSSRAHRESHQHSCCPVSARGAGHDERLACGESSAQQPPEGHDVSHGHGKLGCAHLVQMPGRGYRASRKQGILGQRSVCPVRLNLLGDRSARGDADQNLRRIPEGAVNVFGKLITLAI